MNEIPVDQVITIHVKCMDSNTHTFVVRQLLTIQELKAKISQVKYIILC